MMKIASHWVKLSICALFMLSFCIPHIHEAHAKTGTKESSKSHKDQVILIQTATSGTIEKDKNQQNLYRITLKNVMPYISYVADRPNRTIGKITLEKYLKLWLSQGKNSFKNVPPNAIIHANSTTNNDPEKSEYFALEIFDPTYDNQTQTLVYSGKSLMGEGSIIPELTTINHITLIIDDVCIGCWN